MTTTRRFSACPSVVASGASCLTSTVFQLFCAPNKRHEKSRQQLLESILMCPCSKLAQVTVCAAAAPSIPLMEMAFDCSRRKTGSFQVLLRVAVDFRC